MKKSTSILSLQGSAAGCCYLFLTFLATGETAEPSDVKMLAGLDGWETTKVLTIGETVPNGGGSYHLPGKPDGMGAMALDGQTVRVFINHELYKSQGPTYTLANGTQMTGARISYLDFDKDTRAVTGGGLAFSRVFDRNYQEVTSPSQANELSQGTSGATTYGLTRFCSANLLPAGQFGPGRGLVDTLFVAGEESPQTATSTGSPQGGSFWALDVDSGDLHALPALGRGTWESLTELDTGTTAHVAFLMGDDSTGAPLYLYVGNKGGLGDGSFLDNNGLKDGTLYFWKAAGGPTSPSGFKGTGAGIAGSFVPIAVQDISKAGLSGYDPYGYKGSNLLRDEAEDAGGFNFSRPEDVATNPADGSQAVLASTGRGSTFPDDDWGTVYLVDVDFSGIDTGDISAVMTILFDGDDPDHQDEGIRSPDNVDWADDGRIYVQEDKGTTRHTFGANGEEASIWMLDPTNSTTTRIARITRLVDPPGSSDVSASTVGAWESSGVVDVSSLFGYPGTLLLADVQAHGVVDGLVGTSGLVEGGQILFLESPMPASGQDGTASSWMEDPVLGKVYHTEGSPWIYHPGLGYLFPEPGTHWLYSDLPGLGWLYIRYPYARPLDAGGTSGLSGYVYSALAGHWLYFLPVASDGAHGLDMLYYDTHSGNWELLD